MKDVLLLSLLSGIFMVSVVFGREDWLCTEDSSQVQGSRILACGVGYGANEMDARTVALRNAKDEFDAICTADTACGLRMYRATPSRSTCEKSEDGWVCHRLVIYETQKKFRKAFTYQDPANFLTYNPDVRSETADLMNELIRKDLKRMLSE